MKLKSTDSLGQQTDVNQSERFLFKVPEIGYKVRFWSSGWCELIVEIALKIKWQIYSVNIPLLASIFQNL